MRLAIFSDIHANREAFDASLVHAARQGYDNCVLLGDLVGYGADAQYIVDRAVRLAAAGALVLKGNHDAAAVAADTSGMNEYAAAAIAWTHRNLDRASLDFLAGLELQLTGGDCLFVHSEAAAPADWRYITDEASAARSLVAAEKRITFCGHVHVPQLYNMASGKQAHLFRPQSGVAIPLIGQRKWLAVMGAVGQPRDRNPAAAYAIYDDGRNEVTYHRVPYDIDTAAAKIHAAGLPPMLAARLFVGR